MMRRLIESGFGCPTCVLFWAIVAVGASVALLLHALALKAMADGAR
jgi:hypothetical protein